MRKQIVDFILWATQSRRTRLLLRVVVFSIILIPALTIGCFSYIRLHQVLTQATFERRQSIARLAASVLQEKFSRLIDTGVSLATRVQFRHLVSQGQWEEAIKIFEEIPNNFSYIERIFLTDPEGTLRADYPPLPSVRGKNFSFRDWYKGVRQNWQPYISQAYQRTAAPQYNVVAITVPIK